MKFFLASVLMLMLCAASFAQTVHVEAEALTASSGKTTTAATQDAGGGLKLLLAKGQTFTYSVNIPTAASYVFSSRLDNDPGTTGTASVHFEVPAGTNVSGALSIGAGVQWTTVKSTKSVALPAGKTNVVLVVDSVVAGGSSWLNWFEATAVAVTPPPPTTTPVPCTAVLTNATGALAINCQLPTTLSSTRLRAISFANGVQGVAPNRVPRHVVSSDKARLTVHSVENILKATVTSAHSIALKWTASTDPGVAYTIYRIAGACPASGLTGFAKVAIGLTGTTFSDNTVTAGAWCYAATSTLAATATSSALESVPSNFAAATIPPNAPGGFGCDGTITGQTVGVNCTPTE